jgi:hypothetical protein
MSSITNKPPHNKRLKMNRVSVNSRQQVETILKDIRQWPNSWMGEEKDLVAGEAILGVMVEYLGHLIDKGRAKSTVKKHGDYLWALGGEIIRDLNENGVDQTVSSFELVLNYVDSLGGPYWQHAGSDADHRDYDSVCRSLYKFLQA